jgi:uncharacterized protein
MHIRDVFVDRHEDVRSGWKALVFFLMFSVFIGAGVGPLIYFDFELTYLAQIVTIAAVLGASLLMTRYFHRKPLTAIGLSIHPGVFREFGVGCLLGFMMMTGIFLVEFSLGYFQPQWLGLGGGRIFWILVSSVALFAVGALSEELLFRGYLLQILIQGITFLPAAIIVSGLFLLAHIQNPEVGTFALINVGLAGMWLSFAYMKTRSLWLPFGLHFSWNFSQTTLFAFPTSGIHFADKKMFAVTQTGPEWFTGGAFGPEGGVLATVALIVCTGYILKAKYLAAPEGIITLDSVEDLLPPQTEPRRDNGDTSP